MDRNSIIGIILIFVILVVWGILNQPKQEEIIRKRKIADSLAQIQKKEIISKDSSVFYDTIKENEEKNFVKDTSSLYERYSDFAIAAKGEQKIYTIENNLIKFAVTTLGGRPYSVELKLFKTFEGKPVILFHGDSTVFGTNFYYKNKLIFTNNLYFTPTHENQHIKISDKSDSISFQLKINDNKYIEHTYILHPNSYFVDVKIKLVGLDEIVTRQTNVLDLTWEQYIPQQEKSKKNEKLYTTIYYKHFQDEVEFFRTRTNKQFQEINIPTKLDWIAYKDQFFSTILIRTQTPLENAHIKMINLPENHIYLAKFSSEVGLYYENGNNSTINLQFFCGPNKYRLLKKYKELDLKSIVSVGKGLIKWINQYIIISLFDFLNKFINNYGIIILLMTIIIKIGLLPLTYRSYLSMAKMKALKPKIDEINKKYPKGKEVEKQKAIMELYKKAGVSPLGGCIPQLLQFPILFAMFRFFPTSIELRQQKFLWADDLSSYDSILTLPFTIPGYGDHVSLFTLLMTISTIISIKMSDQSSSSSQEMPGMKFMMYLMPIMFMFILNSFSAALTYYYFLANLIGILQNWIFAKMIDEKELLQKMEIKAARSSEKKKKTSLYDRLEQMAKSRGYNNYKKPKK